MAITHFKSNIIIFTCSVLIKINYLESRIEMRKVTETGGAVVRNVHTTFPSDNQH